MVGIITNQAQQLGCRLKPFCRLSQIAGGELVLSPGGLIRIGGQVSGPDETRFGLGEMVVIRGSLASLVGGCGRCFGAGRAPGSEEEGGGAQRQYCRRNRDSNSAHALLLALTWGRLLNHTLGAAGVQR